MIYKKTEYRQFLKILRQGRTTHWYEIANALGIEDATLRVWKNTPEAQQAIADGIERCLEEMEKAGKKDWRMWESRLKMLGVNPPEKHDNTHSLSDPVLEVLKAFGLKGTKDAGEAKDATPGTSETNT